MKVFKEILFHQNIFVITQTELIVHHKTAFLLDFAVLLLLYFICMYDMYLYWANRINDMKFLQLNTLQVPVWLMGSAKTTSISNSTIKTNNWIHSLALYNNGEISKYNQIQYKYKPPIQNWHYIRQFFWAATRISYCKLCHQTAFQQD